MKMETNIKTYKMNQKQLKVHRINAYIKKQERSQINNLTLYFKELEKNTNEAQAQQNKANKYQSRNKCNKD